MLVILVGLHVFHSYNAVEEKLLKHPDIQWLDQISPVLDTFQTGF